MPDPAALDAAVQARFASLELIGRGSFGDVFKGFDTELNKEVAIKVIDLEEASNLVPPLDEMSIACILLDLLHAIEYLHNEGKIRRDIKAANILLSEKGDVKILVFLQN